MSEHCSGQMAALPHGIDPDAEGEGQELAALSVIGESAVALQAAAEERLRIVDCLLEGVLAGKTYAEVAAEVGIPKARAWRWVRIALRQHINPDNLAAIWELQAGRLQRLLADYWPQARTSHDGLAAWLMVHDRLVRLLALDRVSPLLSPRLPSSLFDIDMAMNEVREDVEASTELWGTWDDDHAPMTH